MAVFVVDSMSLIFFRDRPQMTVCRESSSMVASTTRPSCDSVLVYTSKSSQRDPYKPIDIDQHSCLCMLCAFHISINSDSPSLVPTDLAISIQ